MKLKKSNYINYKLFIYNPFKQRYKLINNLQINKNNEKLFTPSIKETTSGIQNAYLNIDDNSIGYKYKLEVYSDLYYLWPVYIQKSSVDGSKKYFERTPEGRRIKDEDENKIIWYFEKLKKDKVRIYKFDEYDKSNDSNYGLYPKEDVLTIEESNNVDMFYIKLKDEYLYFREDIIHNIGPRDNNNNKKTIYIYKKRDKTNCEFKKEDFIINYIVDENISSSWGDDTNNQSNISNKAKLKNVNIQEKNISNVIEFYGIENPFPKLYIYNNNLNYSLKPCSYIYSKNNSIIENMQSEITYITDKKEHTNNSIKYFRVLHTKYKDSKKDGIFFHFNKNEENEFENESIIEIYNVNQRRYYAVMLFNKPRPPINYNEGDVGNAHGRIALENTLHQFKKNHILIYLDKNTTRPELKQYIENNKSFIEELETNFINDHIRGNMFGKNGEAWIGNNLIYNYCSNNLQHYSNKQYAYDYLNPDQKYYMMDSNSKTKLELELKDDIEDNYLNKKRIVTRELSMAEIKANILIGKLTSGFNIVSYTNGKNLNNMTPLPEGIFSENSGDSKIFKNLNSLFRLEWKNKNNTAQFKTGLSVNIRSLNNKSEIKGKYLYNIKTGIDILNPRENQTLNNKPYHNYENVASDYDENVKEKRNKTLQEARNNIINNFVNNFDINNNQRIVDFRDNYNYNLSKCVINEVPYSNESKCMPPKKFAINKNVAPPISESEFNIIKRNLINSLWWYGFSRFKEWIHYFKWSGPRFKHLFPEYKNFVDKPFSKFIGGSKCTIINNSCNRNETCNKSFDYTIMHKTKFIDMIIKNEQNNNNLITAYKNNIKPTYIFNNKPKDNNDDIIYKWRIEFEDIYDPNNTEFHLYNYDEGKYLVNETKTFLNSTSEIYNIMWSNEKILNRGWKFIINNNDETPTISDTDYNKIISKKIKAYFVKMFKKNNTIIEKFTNKNNIFTTKTQSIKTEYNTCIETTRTKIIKSISLGKQGCYLFSPNIGEFGSFLHHNIPYDASQNELSVKPSWKTTRGDIFYITSNKNSYITENNNNEKISISTVMNNNKYYLKKTINNSPIFVWTKTNDTNTLWNFNHNGTKLELDVDKIQTTYNDINDDIKKKYNVIKNDSITVEIGKIISRLDGCPANNVYDAIRWAEQAPRNKQGVKDYAWIVKSYNRFYFYDDDYMNYQPNPKVTTCWYVLRTDNILNNLYLEYNKIKYIMNNTLFIKRKNVHHIQGWAGVFDWQLPVKPWQIIYGGNRPSNKWLKRQKNFVDISITQSNNYSITKPLYVYFSESTNNNYLSSNNRDKITLDSDKNIYFNGWHIIPDYKSTSQFLSQYENNVNKFANKIYNYLYDLSEQEDFIIFNDMHWFGSEPTKRFLQPVWNSNEGWKYMIGAVNASNLNKIKRRFKWKIKNINKTSLELEKSQTHTYIKFEANIVSSSDLVMSGVSTRDKPNFAENIRGRIYKYYQSGEKISKSRSDNVMRINIYYIIEGAYEGYYLFQNITTQTFLVTWPHSGDYFNEPTFLGDETTDKSDINDILNLHISTNIKKYSNKYMFRVSALPKSNEDFYLLFKERILTD